MTNLFEGGDCFKQVETGPVLFESVFEARGLFLEQAAFNPCLCLWPWVTYVNINHNTPYQILDSSDTINAPRFMRVKVQTMVEPQYQNQVLPHFNQ